MREDQHVVSFLLVPAEAIWAVDRMSERMIARLLKALQIYQKDEYDYFVVSGGIFNPIYTQTVPAATLMKQWLMAHGIHEENILVEDKSLDTYQNVQFSVDIISREMKKYPNYPSCEEKVMVVSDTSHLARIKMVIEGYVSLLLLENSEYKMSLSEKLVEKILFAITFFDRDGKGYLAELNRYWRDQS